MVIAGGGFAALEAAVALRALAQERVRLTVVSPDPYFHYRPAATFEAVGGDPRLAYDLGELVSGLGGRLEIDRVAAVSAQVSSLRLESDRWISYDALILALGAVGRAVIPGALTFRDQRDVELLRGVLDQACRGELNHLVFAVPAGQSWSLPAYELALLCAGRLQEAGRSLELSLVTPEPMPMEAFGRETSALIGDLLAASGVQFRGGSIPRVVSRDALELEFDAPVRADVVVAVPELRGRRIPGVPASWLGFVPVDRGGHVEGLADVYAAGDITTFPIKQGGLAAQQADAVAHAVAETVGAPVHEFHSTRILQARLLGGSHPLFLRAELDEFGQPIGPTIERFEYGEAPAVAKVSARYLGPYLDSHTPTSALQVA